MATRQNYKLSTSERRRRTFSENFKIKKVREIETGLTKVSDICKQYDVSSTAVYQWKEKYGIMQNKKERLIVESESDTKELLALKSRVSELERLIGQKQIQLEFQNKLIDLAEETYGIEIKKNYSTEQSSTSGQTEKN